MSDEWQLTEEEWIEQVANIGGILGSLDKITELLEELIIKVDVIDEKLSGEEEE